MPDRGDVMYEINMQKPGYQMATAFRLLALGLLLAFIFVYAALVGYNPLIGVALVMPVLYTVFYLRHEFLFARIFVLTLGFAAFLNLPVTSGGFPVSTVIMMTGFIMWTMVMLLKKDREFIGMFVMRPEHLLVSAFLILMFISIKNSQSIAAAAKQIQLFIYSWLIFFYLQTALKKREQMEKTISWVLAGGLIVGLIGFLEMRINMSPYALLGNRSIFMADVSDVLLNVHAGRINGLIGDAPYHGIYMVVIASLCVYKFFTVNSRLKKGLIGIVFAVASINVLLTASRGALLGLAISLMVIWTFIEIRRKWLIFGGIVAGFFMLLLVVVVAMPEMNTERLYSSEGRSEQTASMRLEHVPIGLAMFFDNPIFGIGPDGFVSNYRRYAAHHTANAFQETVMKTHNTPLQIAAEYGIFGLSILAALYLLTMKRMWMVMRASGDIKTRYLALALFGTLSGYGFFLCTSNSLLDKNLWMVIALAQTLYTLHKSRGEITDEASL